MSESKADAKPCPNCGHCPTCGHTPQPVRVIPQGWTCGSCGTWVYGVHVCPMRTFYPWWQIPQVGSGDFTVAGNANDYVLMNSAGRDSPCL